MENRALIDFGEWLLKNGWKPHRFEYVGNLDTEYIQHSEFGGSTVKTMKEIVDFYLENLGELG